MIWMFTVDIAFYAIVGVVSLPLLILSIATLGGLKYEDARQRVRTFLANWGDVVPQDLLDRLLRLGGISTLVFLLAFTAYTANRIGDAALPHTSAAFGYFRSAKVGWSICSENEWDTLKQDFREVAGIRSDRLMWEKAKAEMGKYDVRLFRTVAVMCLGLALIASAVVGRRRYRRRVIYTALVAWLAVVLTQWLWVERQEQYIENLVSRYQCEHLEKFNRPPDKPEHYPGRWPEMVDSGTVQGLSD